VSKDGNDQKKTFKHLSQSGLYENKLGL